MGREDTAAVLFNIPRVVSSRDVIKGLTLLTKFMRFGICIYFFKSRLNTHRGAQCGA